MSEHTTADPDILGKVVRWAWLSWARTQPDAKPSWLLGWNEIDEGQREVDRRIGRAVAAAVPSVERAELRALAAECDRYRAALERLAGWGGGVGYIAREALAAEKGATDAD